MIVEERTTWRQYLMTTEEAAEEVLCHLTEEQKKQLAYFPKCDLKSLHYRVGVVIRNKLGIGVYYANQKAYSIFDSANNEADRVVVAIWEHLQGQLVH